MAVTPDDSSQGPRAPLALGAALDEAVGAQRSVNAAAGRRTVALAQVLAAAGEAPGLLLDLEVERVVTAPAERRSSVARRALVAEVACALGVTEHVAAGWLADAEVLASKAARTLDLLCSGTISYTHASKLADVVADLDPDAVRKVEDAVLDRASTLTPARFAALARTARDRVHPIPAEVRHQAAALKANVWVDDGRDGMSWLTAHLPSPVAHGVFDKLTRTATKARANGDPRGVGQLRAATMTALLLDDTPAPPVEPVETTRTGRPSVEPVDTPPPSAEPVETTPDIPDPLTTLARTVRPVVHVTVPVTTLAGTSEASATLDGTTPIDADTARHLTARAPTLRRVLTDPITGAMLTMDRRSYVVPADLRAFLTQRDVTCRFPGCRIPATRCDLDHTRAWADGGPTNATNLAALCRRHHTTKHETRWTVEQLDAGVLAWTSPAGRTYLTDPGSAGPGSTDHVLDQLDGWRAEAEALTREASTGSSSHAVTDEPADSAPRSAAHADLTAEDDPPF